MYECVAEMKMFGQVASVLKIVGKSLRNVKQNCLRVMGNAVSALPIIGEHWNAL